MGATLAKNLKVKVGDTVSILSQGFDGSIAAGQRYHCRDIQVQKSRGTTSPPS